MAALLAIVIGGIVLLVCLALALKLLALAICLGAAVIVYFAAEKLIGQGKQRAR